MSFVRGLVPALAVTVVFGSVLAPTTAAAEPDRPCGHNEVCFYTSPDGEGKSHWLFNPPAGRCFDIPPAASVRNHLSGRVRVFTDRMCRGGQGWRDVDAGEMVNLDFASHSFRRL
ncbi:peptidase inhibitor family I36 protein [Actinophytocola sp.]|uniref:peptidase inhibitor family I36 protein n=1 Tax=Actinophytocola sp. TaxID=1872138 RepID=UPI00389B3440